MDHRPSSIAAAAILMAMDHSLTRQALECKINSVSYSGFLELVSPWFCSFIYNQMNALSWEHILINEVAISWPFLSQEDVFQCYNLIQKTGNEELETTKTCKFSGCLTYPIEAINVLDYSSVTCCAIISKRINDIEISF